MTEIFNEEQKYGVPCNTETGCTGYGSGCGGLCGPADQSSNIDLSDINKLEEALRKTGPKR